MKQITVIADDKVGLLADISYILGKSKVNIESVNADIVGKKAIICLVLSDVEHGKNALEASGYKVGDLNSITIKVKDNPGELSKITSLLSSEAINIYNVHMLSRDGKSTVLSLVVDKPKRAAALLKECILNAEEIY
ncbi:hypothetical protein H0O02_04310 [Candidatus Micrarchaeota archaeon]|nr:hypothetical protein [Candidatus Micrarchaeota archaeon]